MSPPLKLLLIDSDPIFRLGICAALEQFEDFQVIAQAGTLAIAREQLAREMPDLAVLELGLSGSEAFKREYPNLPILLLAPPSRAQELLAAKIAGFEGYCPKGTEIPLLIKALRQVAMGKTYWLLPGLKLLQPHRPSTWLVGWRQSGIKQIEESLVEVKQELKNALRPWDRLFCRGRQRELLAARWLVQRLLPVEEVIVIQKQEEEVDPVQLVPPDPSLPAPLLQRDPWTKTLAQIRAGLENHSGIALEIDILKESKQRELLYLLVHLVRDTLAELRYLEVTPSELEERIPGILRNLWQNGTIQFLSKNYPTAGTDANNFAIIDTIFQDARIVKAEILDKIPFVREIFAYFLFDEPLVIDNVAYRCSAPEAKERAAILLANLLLQIANGVMQEILNNLVTVEDIKYSLLQKNFRSSRAIARFRNNIAWRYGQDQYYWEPKQIFESKYRLFRFQENKIKTVFIYSSRQEELQQLKGIPWCVTIALELTDAIAPRMKSIIEFVGSGLVYLLTQIIGKGIGLIGRGIMQGIGNSLQEKSSKQDN